MRLGDLDLVLGVLIFSSTGSYETELRYPDRLNRSSEKVETINMFSS